MAGRTRKPPSSNPRPTIQAHASERVASPGESAATVVTDVGLRLLGPGPEDEVFRKSFQRLWKAVTPRTADPQLWCLIKYSCPGWESALRHSKGGPIDVAIGVYSDDAEAFPRVEAFVKEVAKHAHRWRSLRAPDCYNKGLYKALANRMPLLETLDVGNGEDLEESYPFRGGPHLRHITFYQSNFEWGRANISALESLSLTSLLVEGFTWALELRSALATCPNLKTLKLDNIEPDPDYYGEDFPLENIQLTLPKLESLQVLQVWGQLIAALLPATTQVTALSQLVILPDSPSEIGDQSFSTSVQPGDRALLPTVLRRLSAPQVVTITASYHQIQIRDGNGEGRPENFQLAMDFIVSDWEEKLARVGGAIGGGVPVSLTLEDRLTLDGPIDKDPKSAFLWNFPSLFDIHILDNGYAAEVLRALAIPSQNKTYPCPKLCILQLNFMFDDLSEDYFLIPIRKLLDVRPSIIVIDNNSRRYGQKGFGAP